MGTATRWKAASLHALLSLGVVGFAAALVFAVWFPYPFRELAGGTELFLLISTVDVVLGPVLTLVVFNPRKPRQVFARDLLVIGVLQSSALLYGLNTMYLARPVYLVHEVDRVQLLVAADILDEDLVAAEPAFRKLPHWGGISLIGVRAPRDGVELLRSVEQAMQGRDTAMRPDWWQPLNDHHREVMQQRAVALSSLRARSVGAKRMVDQLLLTASLDEADVVALPLVYRDKVWTILLNRSSSEILGYFPMDPF